MLVAAEAAAVGPGWERSTAPEVCSPSSTFHSPAPESENRSESEGERGVLLRSKQDELREEGSNNGDILKHRAG